MKDGDVVLWEYGSFVKTGGRQFEELVRERENFYRLNGDYFEYYEKGMRKGERAMRISHHENLLERIDAALGQFDLQGIK